MVITAERVIDASLKDVYEVFTDIENAENRLSDVTKVEIVERPDKGLKGLKWRETRVMFGKEATEEMWVNTAKKNSFYEVMADSQGVVYKTLFEFKKLKQGTKVKIKFEGKPYSLSAKILSVIALFFKGVTRKALERDLDDLKDYLEQNK